MRLTVVTPTLRPVGGTEIYVRSAIRAAQDQGWEVRAVVQSVGVERPPCPAVEVGGLVSTSLSPPRLWSRHSSVRALADRLVETSDVIAFHRLPALDLLHAIDRRAPTLVSVHTTDLTCPAGARYLPASGGVCGRTAGARCWTTDHTEGCLSGRDGEPFPRRQKLLALTTVDRARTIADLATGMLFNSEATRADFEQHAARPRQSFVVYPPLPDQPPRDVARASEKLAFVGRVTAFKGALDAVEVLARLPWARLDVLGDGPALPLVRRRAEALGVQDRLETPGWLAQDEVQRRLSSAACLLVPSRCFEGFGQIGPQAVQAGCPVAAFDVGGIAEWCHPPWGKLVPVGDVAGLAAAAAAWMRSLKDGLSTSGWRQEANARWGAARFGRQYTATLKRLVAGDE